MLFKLLASPVLGPLAAVATVADHAIKQHYSLDRVLADFDNLRTRRKLGEISKEEYDELASKLNDDFLIARDISSDNIV